MYELRIVNKRVAYTRHYSQLIKETLIPGRVRIVKNNKCCCFKATLK